MKREEKDLLLRDLCARLPYRVKFRTLGGEFPFTLKWIDDIYRLDGDVKLENANVFLRPMSSMTEEEEEKRQELWHSSFSPTEYATLLLDFCNERHLDYRGLIEKGLAIEVTEDNNPYKD